MIWLSENYLDRVSSRDVSKCQKMMCLKNATTDITNVAKLKDDFT